MSFRESERAEAGAMHAADSELRLLAALTRNAPVAIYHADAKGRLTYANHLYRSMFRLEPGDGLDQWEHVVHPLDKKRMRAAWTDFCNHPRPIQFQWRSVSAAGTTRVLSETVVPMPAQEIGGFVGTIADITELRAAQAEVEQLQRRLLDTGQVAKAEFEAFARKSLLISQLRDAIAQKELELHYQPKLDIASGVIVGAEALVRWRHPDRGLLLPGEFISLAEESGLIGSMGEWIIHEACRQTRLWQDQCAQRIRVAVNLSPSQFRQGNLLDVMRNALSEANLDPRYLELELTESTVMSDAAGSAVILEQLSEMGVALAVDDFGTGYSSLDYLRRFPVDKLKIDRTFIAQMISRPEDACIVRAIVSLGQSLRLKVIAEGVETQEQLEFLRNLGCDQYQGYLFSPAVSADSFITLLMRRACNSFMERDAVRTHSKLAAYRRDLNGAV